MNFYIFINAYHFSGLKMKCKLCEFTCTTVSEYLRHCTNSHSSRSYMPQLPCNRCHLVFNSKTRFYEHYKEHTKSDDVGKETRIINNSKVLTCSHCKENFSSFDIYKSHLRKVYKGNEKVNCPCCNKKEFTTYKAFLAHYSREHKDVVPKQIEMK